ncbi:heavy metal-binding domain-containing protein [Flavobacterium sp.]|uniref:heavy metal-binding domain-containing protein n=1 Tax=Flavobacterium sp. TaxID=239 RepID=UPI002CF4DBBD|nr:heavy metal-binding domain-containing protein [Flavobacterium sp.]HSD07350.1 heavy metal-binding domain-containing protein [Flavobacterium sp.]
MKTLIIALTLFFAMGNAVSAQTTASAPKKEVQKTVYTCPMHPKEVSDKKGKCSKCGMDLVASKEKVKATKETQKVVADKKYICTMDGATSDKPGKCPKCGMALTEKKPEKK